MAITNLFQSLYNSKNKNYVNSGYVCESDLSDNADATAQYGTDENGNPVFEIVDANGNVITSQDLSGIAANPVFEWETKSKVLQPNSCYFIQGPEFGQSYMTEYFKICKELVETEGWEYYCNVEFDITYSSGFETVTSHYKSEREPENTESVLVFIQNWLDCMNIPVNVDFEDKEDTVSPCHSGKNCNMTIKTDYKPNIYSYIRFMSTSLGYNFVVRNLRVYPIFASEDFPESPFSPEQITVQDVIQAIRNVEPYRIDASVKMDPYLIDCSLYLYVLTNLEEGLKYLDDFAYKAPESFEYTVYAGYGKNNAWYNIDSSEPLDSLYYAYDNDTIDENEIVHRGVYPIFAEIFRITGLRSVNPDDTDIVHKLFENLDLRVDALKYPNGAFRGISVVPQYPSVTDKQAMSLKLNIIKDKISIYTPVRINQAHHINDVSLYDDPETEMDDWTEINVESERILWEKEDVIVLAGTNINNERLTGDMRGCNCGVMDIDYESGSIDDDGWNPGNNPAANYAAFNQDYNDNWANVQDPHWRDNRLTMRENGKVIGMFRYLSEISKSNDWINVGQLFTLITNADSASENERNLCNSIFINNPNPFPVKVNIMIFD